MLVKLVVAALLLVIVCLLALRFARSNSIERSISGHKRRLGSIEEIVHRSAELSARERDRPKRLPPKPETELPVAPPVGPTVAPPVGPAVAPPTVLRPPQPAQRSAPGTRAEIEIPGDRRVTDEGRLVFGDLSIKPVVPPVPPIYEQRPRRHRGADKVGTHYRDAQAQGSKAPLFVVAAVVIIVLGGGVAYAIHRNSRHLPQASATTTTILPTRTTVAPPKPKQSTSTQTLHLVSSTTTSATYIAPLGRYHVDVNVAGPCWLGFEHETTGAPWLATPTIGVGGVFSYAFSTSGHLVVVIGATQNLKTVVVNGKTIALPKLPASAFDVIFK